MAGLSSLSVVSKKEEGRGRKTEEVKGLTPLTFLSFTLLLFFPLPSTFLPVGLLPSGTELF
jgi:hypothetical protein